VFPSIPTPENSPIKIPVDAKLKRGWAFDAKHSVFVSDSGEKFNPFATLPKKSQIVYKVPSLAKSDPRKLSAPERDLRLYLQIILPEDCSASDYVSIVREWDCIADANAGPEVSLP
jgi:hypothetical protein